MERASVSSPLDLSSLSPSEREVLERARSGSTAGEVAEQLGLSEATVRTHLSHIYAKLGVRGRVELVARLQGAGSSPRNPTLRAATLRVSPVGLMAVIAAGVVAFVGGIYQAWWSVALVIGGFAIAYLVQRQLTPARSIAIGSAVAGALLLAGMSLFFLYGSSVGGGTPWFVAAISSIVTAVVLLLFALRLLRQRPTG